MTARKTLTTCTATAKQTGKPCTDNAIPGGTVCERHGGNAPQVKSAANVRAEIMEWAPGTATDDPGEVLLALVTQSKARCVKYAGEVHRLVEQATDENGDAAPDLTAILTGDKHGEFGKVGEYVRAMVELEERERDRCAGFAAKAIAAGLAERMVRLAERQAEVIAQIVRAALADETAALTPEQIEAVSRAAGRELRQLTA